MSWVLRKCHTQLNRKRYKVLSARKDGLTKSVVHLFIVTLIPTKLSKNGLLQSFQHVDHAVFVDTRIEW